MGLIQDAGDWLALNEYLNLLINADCVVNLFAFLANGVCGELRNDLGRIEDVIAKSIEEGQDNRCLDRLFSQHRARVGPDPIREDGKRLFYRHLSPLNIFLRVERSQMLKSNPIGLRAVSCFVLADGA